MTPDQRAALTAADAAVVALVEAHRVLRASLADPAPAPAPSPVPTPPAPAPAPEPPAPPSGDRPPALVRALGLLIWFEGWCTADRAQHWQALQAFKAADGPAKIVVNGMAPGGLRRAFSDTRYTLMVMLPSGQVAREIPVAVAAGDKTVTVQVPLDTLAEGWYVLDFVPATSTGETAVYWAIYVQKGAKPVPQPWIPVVVGSWTLSQAGGPSRVHWVPGVFNPRTVPFVQRDTPPMPTIPKRSELMSRDLVVHRGSDIYRPRLSEDGVLNTMNVQGYYFNSLNQNGALVNRVPGLPQMDGPRGVGTVVMATHLQFNHTGGLWFCESTRVGVIFPDGRVLTLAGARHSTPPVLATIGKPMIYPELVGDWSAIPEARRGFHETWGMAWDERGLVRDGPAVDVGGVMMPTHRYVHAFVADSQNNRIIKIAFDRNDATMRVPCVVTEFLTGLADPWDLVAKDGKLYVTERTAHRIIEIDIDTKAVRVMVQGAPLSTIDGNSRKPKTTTPRDVLRAQPCQLPEGLVEQDGWLYWGSFVTRQTKRVNIATLAVEVIKNYDSIWEINDNSAFFKLAISDGTFGPRGTLFVTSWSNANYGFPIPLDVGVAAEGLGGPGRPLNRSEYGSALAIANGKLATSSMAEGITIFSKALPGAPVLTKTGPGAAYFRGATLWMNLGYHFTHGPGGWGYNQDPLPWGESADMDVYLILNGHSRPTSEQLTGATP